MRERTNSSERMFFSERVNKKGCNLHNFIGLKEEKYRCLDNKLNDDKTVIQYHFFQTLSNKTLKLYTIKNSRNPYFIIIYAKLLCSRKSVLY